MAEASRYDDDAMPLYRLLMLSKLTQRPEMLNKTVINHYEYLPLFPPPPELSLSLKPSRLKKSIVGCLRFTPAPGPSCIVFEFLLVRLCPLCRDAFRGRGTIFTCNVEPLLEP